MENSISVTVKNRYMVIPIDTKAEYKSLRFFENGKMIFDTKIRIAEGKSDYTAYLDVERFNGKTLEVLTVPEGNIPYTFSDVDEFTERRKNERRPYYHFVPPMGWLNDPNGLCKYNGKYQLFYQYCPSEPAFFNNNMNWGHAESEDLFHWKDLPIALFPDDTGSMYSGSGIVDENNVSGLEKDGKKPFFLFYTASGGRTAASEGKNYSQNYAVSYDGVKFEKSANNPIAEEIAPYNRDPKVFFIPEVNLFGMVIFLKDNMFQLLKSSDLVNWEEWQKFTLEGDSECPDFLRAKIGNEYKWVFIAAHDGFAVGTFGKDGFHREYVKKPDGTTSKYAAQSFSGLGDRIIRIYWEKVDIPNTTCTQQMSVPLETKFDVVDGEYRISLLPVEEIKKISKTVVKKENIELSSNEKFKVNSFANDFTLKFPYVENEKVTVKAFGTDVLLDMENNVLSCSGMSVPLSENKKYVDLRMLTDTHSFEIFTDKGHNLLVRAVNTENSETQIEFISSAKVKVDELTVDQIENTMA